MTHDTILPMACHVRNWLKNPAASDVLVSNMTVAESVLTTAPVVAIEPVSISIQRAKGSPVSAIISRRHIPAGMSSATQQRIYAMVTPWRPAESTKRKHSDFDGPKSDNGVAITQKTMKKKNSGDTTTGLAMYPVTRVNKEPSLSFLFTMFSVSILISLDCENRLRF